MCVMCDDVCDDVCVWFCRLYVVDFLWFYDFEILWFCVSFIQSSSSDSFVHSPSNVKVKILNFEKNLKFRVGGKNNLGIWGDDVCDDVCDDDVCVWFWRL